MTNRRAVAVVCVKSTPGGDRLNIGLLIERGSREYVIKFVFSDCIGSSAGTMALLRAGLVVSMMFIFLVVAPVSVLGDTTGLLHEEDGVSGILSRGSPGVELGSPGHIDRGFSGRKMLAAGRPVETSGPGSEAPTDQLDKQASTVDSTVPSAETQSTSTAPAPRSRFATRFAFLFRSLAKGSSPPSTGTPSPGHN